MENAWVGPYHPVDMRSSVNGKPCPQVSGLSKFKSNPPNKQLRFTLPETNSSPLKISEISHHLHIWGLAREFADVNVQLRRRRQNHWSCAAQEAPEMSQGWDTPDCSSREPVTEHGSDRPFVHFRVRCYVDPLTRQHKASVCIPRPRRNSPPLSWTGAINMM